MYVLAILNKTCTNVPCPNHGIAYVNPMWHGTPRVNMSTKCGYVIYFLEKTTMPQGICILSLGL